MSKWKVGHNYSARVDGTMVSYVEGDEIEIEDAVALRVNQDSPGTLEPVTVKRPSAEGHTRKRKTQTRDGG